MYPPLYDDCNKIILMMVFHAGHLFLPSAHVEFFAIVQMVYK